MTLPEFLAWHRFAFMRAVARKNAAARAEWNERVAEMKRREGRGS